MTAAATKAITTAQRAAARRYMADLPNEIHGEPVAYEVVFICNGEKAQFLTLEKGKADRTYHRGILLAADGNIICI